MAIFFGNKHNSQLDGKYLTQVHSNKVVVVTDHNQETENVEADALVTTLSNVKLSIKTADCVPILLQGNNVIGALHAGWRGAYSGIIQNTIKTMREISNGEIKAFIGPSIRQNNYEIDKEFRDRFLEQDHANSRFFNGLNFDLPGYCKGILQRLGVENITDDGIDTYSNPDDYFSYRYYTKMKLELGREKRQVSLIVL